jgi:hypothetical protein
MLTTALSKAPPVVTAPIMLVTFIEREGLIGRWRVRGCLMNFSAEVVGLIHVHMQLRLYRVYLFEGGFHPPSGDTRRQVSAPVYDLVVPFTAQQLGGEADRALFEGVTIE